MTSRGLDPNPRWGGSWWGVRPRPATSSAKGFPRLQRACPLLLCTEVSAPLKGPLHAPPPKVGPPGRPLPQRESHSPKGPATPSLPCSLPPPWRSLCHLLNSKCKKQLQNCHFWEAFFSIFWKSCLRVYPLLGSNYYQNLLQVWPLLRQHCNNKTTRNSGDRTSVAHTISLSLTGFHYF